MEHTELIPVIQIVDGTIQDNLAVLESKVTTIATQYKGLVVTNIPEAKKTLANLRGLIKRINDEKIAAKKIYLSPFEAIEQKVKEFQKIIEAPITEIDQQIKESEQLIRTEREGVIDSLLNQASHDFTPVMKEFFDSVSWKKDPSWTQEKYWTGKGNPTSKLREEIEEKVNTCRDGVTTILSVAGECTDQILAFFKTSGNLGNSLSILEEKSRAKAQAEAFKQHLSPPEPSIPSGSVEDAMPSFMQQEGTLPSFMMQEIPTPQESVYTLQITCSHADFIKVRSALALVRVRYEVL